MNSVLTIIVDFIILSYQHLFINIESLSKRIIYVVDKAIFKGT